MQNLSKKLLPAIYLIWAGLIAGVSFIATPVKFQAPNLTMAVALEIGQATFHLFNIIEWIIITLAAVLTIIAQNSSRKLFVPSWLFILMSLQTFWILPILDVKASHVINGGTPSPGSHHWFYIIAELIKLTLTIVAAWLYSRKEKS